MNTSRRTFLLKSILAPSVLSAPFNSLAEDEESIKAFPSTNHPDKNSFPISIFSKNLHWLDYTPMADVAADLGFDGVDLTVRPEGHVVPERVAEDLPKAVEALRKAGLQVYMITTAITDAEDKFTELILKTAGSLGINAYRMGWISYNDKLSLEENAVQIQKRLSKLAALNKKYNIRGDYQNHSGTSFGSPVWDLASVLKNLKTPWIGSQYDIRHAVVEGANSWPLGLKLIKPFIKTIDIKDFIWVKKNNQSHAENTPLGEGMVDFKKYFALLKEYNISAPISIHYEYPLGGAEDGAKVLTIAKGQVLAAMKKDLLTLSELLKLAGLK